MTAEKGSFIRGVGGPMLRCNARWESVDANQAALTLFGEPTVEALCVRLRSIDTRSNAIHDLDAGRILITRVVLDDVNLLQCASVGEAPRDGVPPLVRLYTEAFRASPTPTMVADRRSRKPIDVNGAG